MHISAARQNSNCTRMRIGGVRGVYPHNIHTPASNNPRGTWCNYPCGLTNDDVTWTITIAIVPPENKQKQKNCRDDKPARVQTLIINFLGLVALERQLTLTQYEMEFSHLEASKLMKFIKYCLSPAQRSSYVNPK